MRTPKFLPLFALATVLAIFAACGGDGDNGGDGGDGALELPPAGEYQFTVEATIELTLIEESVSAVAVGQQQTYSGSGTGSVGIDFSTGGSGTFGDLKIDFTVQRGDGGSFKISVIQSPDQDSTLEVGSGGTSADLNIRIEETDPAPTGGIIIPFDDYLFPVDAAGDPTSLPLNSRDIDFFKPLILGFPDDDPVPLAILDNEGNAAGEIDDFTMTLFPIEDGTQPDAADEEGDEVDDEGGDVDEEQLSAEEEAYRMVVGPFGLTPQEYVNIQRFGDPRGDFIYSIFGTTPGLTEPQQDVLRIFAGIFDLDPDASQAAFGNTAFPCDTLVGGTRTVCSAGAGAVPPGEVIVLAMVLDGDIPLEDPDKFYTYAAVFDADGDPTNNFQYVDPYNWDYFQNTDLWYQLDWDPTVGQWQLFVSSFVDQIPQNVASNARVVIDGNVIVFFIPVGEFGVPRPGFRLTTFGHDGTYAPEASGGDVSGADPTEPLLELPAEAIVIEEVEDVSTGD